MGLEYALPFPHVLVVWIVWHVGVIVVGVDVFKAVEGMAKAGGVFGLRLDEAGEVVVLPMLAEDLEDFYNGVLDVFNVGVGRHPHHSFEDISRGGEGVGDIIRG